MIDYIAVDENLRKDVLDGKAVRGIYEELDHYVVFAKKGRWEYGRRNSKQKVSKVISLATIIFSVPVKIGQVGTFF